jgi:hypothetical protein
MILTGIEVTDSNGGIQKRVFHGKGENPLTGGGILIGAIRDQYEADLLQIDRSDISTVRRLHLIL